MSNATGRYTTTYDDLSRKRSVSSPVGKRLTYSYDANSRRTQLQAADAGVFTYSYDNNGQLKVVKNPQGDRTTFVYDDDGRRTLKYLSNGSRTTFSYDNANRLTQLSNIKSNGSVVSTFNYTDDFAGNKLQIVESGGAVVTWSYDKTYQLTAEYRTGSNAYRYTYTYDAAGNRTVKNLTGTRTTTTYDAANQIRYALDGSGRTTYSYDADGNQTRSLTPAGARTTTTYDYENRTTLIRLPSGVRNTMSYDPDGLRVKLEDSTGVKKFVYDNQAYLLETEGSNVLTAVFTQEPTTYGNLISQRRGSTTSWYAFDATHSTRQLLDASQNTTDSYLYDAFGNTLASAGNTPNPFQWHGAYGCYRDPDTGLYYLRARIINPVIAVFTTADPLRFVNGMNLYRLYFVPSLTDPSGLVRLPFRACCSHRRNCTWCVCGFCSDYEDPRIETVPCRLADGVKPTKDNLVLAGSACCSASAPGPNRNPFLSCTPWITISRPGVCGGDPFDQSGNNCSELFYKFLSDLDSTLNPSGVGVDPPELQQECWAVCKCHFGENGVLTRPCYDDFCGPIMDAAGLGD